MNSYRDRSMDAFWVTYLIFGIGCILFFFSGVCALLCCCRQRFRGIKRPGYIIREPQQDQRTPLMMPAVTNEQGTTVVLGGNYPAQSPPYPVSQPQAPYPTSYPPTAPPAYQTPPKF